MRTGILLCLFFGFCLISTTSFKAKETTIDDKTLLDIVANHQTFNIYNAAFQKALIKCTASKTISYALLDKLPIDTNKNIKMDNFFYQVSNSEDSTTHGLKVFKLFVKDKNAYTSYAEQPEGQTLVKATWYSEHFTFKLKATATNKAVFEPLLPLNDSIYLRPTLPSDYFIMFKSTSGTYLTDNGWIYGIVSADGKRVIEKGLIKSCMSCHDESKEDRMLHVR